MKVTLEDYTLNPLQKIGKFAAICYGAKTDMESNIKRAQHCVNSGHLSTLRFAYATFHVEDISRVCLAQLTRSKHLDYLVRSSRYCDEAEAKYYMPSAIERSQFKHEYEQHVATSADLYQRMREEEGITKQDARFVLPQAQVTALYVTGNFQAWRDFIKLRTTKAAQCEVREVALEIQRQLVEIAPEIFG
jgi:thymidylate synthase (FAD)